MELTIFESKGYHFAIPDPGVVPAIVLALKGRAVARLTLIPRVEIVEVGEMAWDDAEAARDWVIAERDRCLEAWMGGLKVQDSLPFPPRVTEAKLDRGRRALMLLLADGGRMLLPIAADPDLRSASDDELAEIELVSGGEVLRWPGLERYRLVRDLLAAASGLIPWRQDARYAVDWPAAPEQPAPPQANGWVGGGAPPQGTYGTPAAEYGQPAPSEPFAQPAPPEFPRPAPLSGRVVKSLLGLILYREGYLTQPQLQKLFQEQVRLRGEGRDVGFGQLATEHGMITAEQMQFGIHLQNNLAHAGDQKPLGVSLMEAAVVIPSQLLAALEEQKRTGERLGEVLVRQGSLTRATLEDFLMRQKDQRGASFATVGATVQPPAPAQEEQAAPEPVRPVSDPSLKMTLAGTGMKSLLGIILERENYLTQAQVRAVIEEQDRRRSDGNKTGTFGETAIELNLISDEQLKAALQMQAKLAQSPGKRKPIGFYLLENGVVKPSQLVVALEESARTERRVGEVLVEHGVVSEQMINVFLKIQAAQSQ